MFNGLRKLRVCVFRLKFLAETLGWKNGVYVFLDEVRGKKNIRQIFAGDFSIFIRTGTSDINVLISNFFEDEYSYLDHEAPSIIMDVGANIGISAVCFARKFPNASVFAVEPEKDNFELLKKNTESFANIIPINAAIWGAPGRRSIKDRGTGSWGFTVLSDVCDTESTPLGQHVNCITVIDFMRQYELDNIDILKMDIEGGEKNVLENARDWIDSVTVLTVELHDRISMGCDRAFYLATQSFNRFERHGEKVTAYRV
jgi:FkbM family methyltransferase